MTKLTIKSLEDEHDCETCGSSWEQGFEVYIDGKPFGDYAPLAACWDSKGYLLENVLVDVLKYIGYDVEVV